MPKYSVSTIITVHSFRNRKRIEKAVAEGIQCSCFHCCLSFFGEDITEWTDGGATALCPMCTIDSVLPYEVPESRLVELHRRIFKEGK